MAEILYALLGFLLFSIPPECFYILLFPMHFPYLLTLSFQEKALGKQPQVQPGAQ